MAFVKWKKGTGSRHGGETFSHRRHGDEIGDPALTAVPAAAKRIPEVIPLQVLNPPKLSPARCLSPFFTRSLVGVIFAELFGEPLVPLAAGLDA